MKLMPSSSTALSSLPASSSLTSGPVGGPRSSIAPKPRAVTSSPVRPSVCVAMSAMSESVRCDHRERGGAVAYDLVIRGGTVVDGTGAPAFRADVAVNGDRIVAVGAVDGKGKSEIDAEGHVVTPGFID